MALDKVNQHWKAAVNKGKNGTRVTVRGARVSLIDLTFWRGITDDVAVTCPTSKHVEAKKDRKACLYGPKSKTKDYACFTMTPKCVGQGEMTWAQWTRYHPLVADPSLLRSRRRHQRRRRQLLRRRRRRLVPR